METSVKTTIQKIRIGHSGNKILASLSMSENEVPLALIAAMSFPEKFCTLDLQAEWRSKVRPSHRSDLSLVKQNTVKVNVAMTSFSNDVKLLLQHG